MTENSFLSALEATAASIESEPVTAPAAEPASEPEPQAAEPEAVAVEPTGDGEPEPAAPTDDVAPPEHWSAKDKDAFAKADPETRGWLLGRFKEMERGIGAKAREAAELRKQAEPILAAVQPYLTDLQASGMTPDAAVRQLLAFTQGLQSDPAKYIGRVIDVYGRPLAGSAPARDLVRSIARDLRVEIDALYDEDGQTAPVAAPANREIEDLRAELERVQQQLHGFGTMTRQQQAEAQWRGFETAAGPDGQPRYPHATELRGTMANLVNSDWFAKEGEPDHELFARAYETAVRMSPDLARKADEASRQAEQARQRQQRADTARQAATRPQTTATPGGRPSDAKPATFRDGLAAAMDKWATQRDVRL